MSALANNPGLLKALYDRVAELELLGERENAEILLLAAVALVCGKPISAIIKGTSAVGKSEIIKAVTRALPPEMIVERQSMSSQSLVYMGENGQLRNKVRTLIEQVRRGDLATGRAAVMIQAYNCLLRAEEAARRVRETEELAAELEELRRALA